MQEQPASEESPKQKTFRGYEIPVPLKKDVMAFFKKAARTTKQKP